MKKRILPLLLCLLLVGCQPAEVQPTASKPLFEEEEPVLPAQGASVLHGVTAADRVMSLVLEGFTDDDSMRAIGSLLSRRPVVFFLTAAAISEHPETAESLSAFELGNYAIVGSKSMELNSAAQNQHQFTKAQEIIHDLTGQTPTLFRCNGSAYTETLLRTAASCGLTEAVEPSLYLNHRSLTTDEAALRFVRDMPRGSIVSFKLGQELDLAEYGDRGEMLDEKPAIDPPPSLSDGMLSTVTQNYQNAVDGLARLLSALRSEGYRIVSPRALAAYEIDDYRSPRTLTAQQETLLLPSERLTSAEPFGSAHTTVDAQTVLVGDSVLLTLARYVELRRQVDPTYFGGATILAASGLSVGNALWKVSDASAHLRLDDRPTSVENAIRQLGGKRVFLMLGLNDLVSHSVDEYIRHYMLLLHLIRVQNPQAEITIVSLLPGIAERSGRPSNRRLYEADLALYRLCLQYDFSYLDAAYCLRDADGALPLSLCADVSTSGLHLNDRGCQALLSVFGVDP